MFNQLRNTIKGLNADVNNVANSEKAKKLRAKLLRIGLPMAIGGFLGVFICFATFAIGGFNMVETGFSAAILIPFLLFLPCGIVGGIGLMITSLGFKIIVVGYTTNLVNETVGNNCPKCGNEINPDMPFCAQCGAKVRNECPQCHHVNRHQSEFCEKCGTKLKDETNK